MKATLLNTDNDEVVDLIGQTHRLINESGAMNFDDLVFIPIKTSVENHKITYRSKLGNVYVFRIAA
jgi:hypothetical protein